MKESKAPSLGRTPAQKFLDKWQGLIYLIPWIIGFIVFKAIPFGQSLYYSFTDMNFFNGIHQYGVMNYVTAFSDAKVTKALVTTFKYAFVTVPLKLIFALFIAYILNFQDRLWNLFRTVLLHPVHSGRLRCHRRAVEGRFPVMMVWSTPSSAPSPSATHRALLAERPQLCAVDHLLPAHLAVRLRHGAVPGRPEGRACRPVRGCHH